MKQKFIHEREVWLVNLEPTHGIEIQKVRPCLDYSKIFQSAHHHCSTQQQTKAKGDFLHAS